MRGFGALGPGHAGAGLCHRRKDFDAILRGRFFKLDDAPKTFYQGRTALARGDIESAQRYFAAATPAFEGAVRDDPDDRRASRSTRITLRLHAEEGGCHPRRSSRGRTRAGKPERISWRSLGGQSGAGLCARGRTGPGDHADRASPFHSRPVS